MDVILWFKMIKNRTEMICTNQLLHGWYLHFSLAVGIFFKVLQFLSGWYISFLASNTQSVRCRAHLVPARQCNSRPGLVKKENSATLTALFWRRLQRTFKYKVFVPHSATPCHGEGDGDYICSYQTEFSFCLFLYMWQRSFNMIKSILKFGDPRLLSLVVFFIASEWPLYEMVDL